MLQFLICRCGWDEEAFTVSIRVISDLFNVLRWLWIWKCTTHPAVNRPTILVPPIVAWQMGMTSCNSDSNILITTTNNAVSIVLNRSERKKKKSRNKPIKILRSSNRDKSVGIRQRRKHTDSKSDHVSEIVLYLFIFFLFSYP